MPDNVIKSATEQPKRPVGRPKRGEENAPVEEDFAITQRDSTIAQILTAFNAAADDDEWHIKVYEYSGNHKERARQPWLFNCEIEDLEGLHERLLVKYGSGRYVARVYCNNTLYRLFNIDVKAPPGEDPKNRVFHNPPESNSNELITAINQNFERLAQLFVRSAAPPATVDPMAQFERMTAVMLNMQKLTAPPPAAPAVNGIEIVKQVIEMSQSLAGGGKETSMMDVFQELVKSPFMEGLLGSFQKPGGPGAPAPEFRPGPGYGDLPDAPPAQLIPPTLPPNFETMDQQQVMALIGQQLHYLITKAESGRSPGLYAEWVLDNIPEPTAEMMLADPNILNGLATINPAVNNYRPWFEHLLVEMREMLKAEPQHEEEPDAAPRPAIAPHGNTGRTGRDAANPAADGGTRPKVQEKPKNQTAQPKPGPGAAG